MNCPKCGAINNNDAKFCGTCGNVLSAPEEVNKEEILDVEELTVEPPQAQPTMVPLPQNTQVEPTPTVPSTPEIIQSQDQLAQSTIEENVPVQPVVNNTPENQSANINNIPNPQQPNKSNKTLFIILGAILAVIIIAVAGIGIFYLATPSEEREEKKKINAMFNPDNLIKVKSEDKYGYINTEGKFVIKATYDEATDFIGDYAVVRSEVEVDGLTKSVYQIIDKKGNVKKQAENGIEYVTDVGAWVIDEQLYSESMKLLSPKDTRVEYDEDGYFIWVNSKENTGGIMNEKGKQTYTYKFQEGESYISVEASEIDESLKEKYCRVNIENDKYAIVNCDTGVVVHDFTENYVSTSDDNIFTIKNHDTWDFIEIMYIQNDKKAYHSTNEEIDLYYYPGYVSIRDGSKSYDERYQYLHTSTLEIKAEKPSSDSSTEEEIEEIDEWEKLTNNKKFNCSTGYGLMNGEQVTLTCEWDVLEYLDVDLYKYLKDEGKEYIYGEKEDKWYLIDLKTKKAIIEFNTSYIIPKTGTTFMYYTDKDTNNKKVYNLLSGKSLNVDSDKSLNIYSNYITVKDTTEKTLKYYNTDLKLIYTESL